LTSTTGVPGKIRELERTAFDDRDPHRLGVAERRELPVVDVLLRQFVVGRRRALEIRKVFEVGVVGVDLAERRQAVGRP
jgi:hypothetical protein